MPCMSTNAYQKQVDSILEVVEDYTKQMLELQPWRKSAARDSNLCGPEEKKPFFKSVDQPVTLEDSKAPLSL